ncbi:hypothetical protein K502DRAFT_352541 [Neoconidiobolus thromboides FSU 785]|nr:hypothetical protein K502DRAFT_352541 [Neoconidiobolus thromboides FSU 785]
MQTFITKFRNVIFENFNIIGKNTQYKHCNSFTPILRATYNSLGFMEFYNKTKQRKDILSKFTIDNNKLNQAMYKIGALRETGNENQQVALLSTIASVYSFGECKSFEFNTNRNQYDYPKKSNNNNNKRPTLQPIIKNTKKIKDEQIEAIIQYLLNDSAISSRFNKNNDDTIKNKVEIEVFNEEEKLYKVHKFCVGTQKNTFNETIKKSNNKSCITILDFIQNMETGTRPDSTNSDHYNKQAISVLSFGVLYLKDDKTIAKVYFDYLSEIINHHSAYAGDCLIDLISTELLFKKFTKINIWADKGNHFRSQGFPHYIFKETHKINSSLNIDLNSFPEHHEKSIVDGHFRNLSEWKSSFEVLGKIEDINRLISRFKTFICEHSKITRL